MKKPLQYYPDTWHLSDPSPLAQTPTSHIYLVTSNQEKAVLKILTPAGQNDEQHGATVLAYFNGDGAIRVLNHDAGASLLEYADGGSLMDVVESGDDEQATVFVGGVLNRLHRARPHSVPSAITSLNDRFHSLFAKAEQDRSTSSVYVRAAPL